MRFLLHTAAVAVLALFPQQQAAQPPAGAISGVVTDMTTGQPIAGAVVSLGVAVQVGQPWRLPRQVTDDLGRFVFSEIPAGSSVTITVSKGGYFAGSYGRRGQTGLNNPPRQIAIAAGQWLRDLKIELLKYASITGTVRNETGDPMAGVTVRAYVDIVAAGVRQLAASQTGSTDDRGEYRIESLPPGKYIVAVPSTQHAAPASLIPPRPETTTDALSRTSGVNMYPALAMDPIHRLILTPDGPPLPPASGGRRLVYPITFHPAARAIAEATPVEITGGDDKTAIDIQMRPAPGFRVSGRLDGPSDAVAGMSLRLLTAGTENIGRGIEQATALVGNDSTFTFLNVPSGTYTLIANRVVSQYSVSGAGIVTMSPLGVRGSSVQSTAAFGAPPGTMVTRSFAQGSNKYQGRSTVVVSNQDVSGVAVPMQAGVSISGRIIYDSNDPERMAAVSTVTAEPADGDLAAGQPRFVRDPNDDDSTYFFIEGVLPGAYLLRTAGGGTLKSVVISDRDYSDRPLEIESGKNLTGVVVTVTDRLTTLTGSIRDRDGKPVTGSGVVIFPADRALWKNFGNQPRRLRYIVASGTGTYTLRVLPAGDYFAVAVDESTGDRWQDPAFLDAAVRVATRFTLTWGESTTVDVVLQAIK